MRPPAMRWAALTCTSFAMAFALAPNASAEEAAERRGVYLSGALGFAYGAERVVDQSSSGGLSGDGAGARIAIGLAPFSGVAVAFEARFLIHGGYAEWDRPSVGDPRLRVLGALVDYYPHARGPAHLEFGLGLLAASLSRVEVVADSATSPTSSDFDSMRGVFGHAGFGFTWPVARDLEFGPLFDVYRGRAAQGTARLDIYGGAFELGVTFF